MHCTKLGSTAVARVVNSEAKKMHGDCRACEHPARQRGLSTLNVLPTKGSASRVTLWH